MVILLIVLSGCETKPEPLTIAIMGDQTGSYDLAASYDVMQRAAARMKAHAPDLVLHVGDMTESRVGEDELYRADFQRATEIMRSVGVPWFLVAGDHDVNPQRFEPASTDRSHEARFLELCRDIGLPMQDKLYYSIDFNDYHLVFLYSIENLHTDPRWGSIFLNGISDAQLSWLSTDLETHADSKGIIVVTHHPHWYAWSNWYPVHTVLRKHPVAAVIAGHYHYDQDGGEIDGIRYLVMGATGGAIKNADPESGGSQQYGLITLAGSEILQYELHEVYSDSILEITPRRSMDRIQALSTVMSNIYNDEAFLWSGDSLFTQDKSEIRQPAQSVTLESPANPIDLPIDLRISSMNELLLSPRWVRSDGGTDGSTEMTLDPGERIGWANYSSTGHWFTPPPLWRADLAGGISEADSVPIIGVDIRMSFTDIRSRWIMAQVMFPVKQ